MNAVNRQFILLIALSGIAPAASAQDKIDEDQLFADTMTVTQTPLAADTQSIGDYSGRKSVGISGMFTSVALASASRDIKQKIAFENTSLATWITGDILLDVRLKGGYKAFASMEATYRPEASGAENDTGLSFFLPEIFVDANYRNKLYFRTGKQVLQWGRCYFWNPTDLVNIEQRQFIRKIGLRQGTYGVKLHIPSGVARNFYGFLGTYGAKRPDQTSLAAKYEFLLGGTEMAFGVWGKRHFHPVYGYDVSSRVLGIDISGELGLHQRYQLKKVSLITGELSTETKNWISQACLDLSRSFTIGQIKDRLATTVELYYNCAGSADRKIINGYYQPNNYSRFYSAFFASLGKFILSDITLSLNAIGNLNQGCAMVTAGLSYQNLSDFNIGFSINGYLGPDNTEYTISNDGIQAQLTAGLSF